jgi:hypothetical protein
MRIRGLFSNFFKICALARLSAQGRDLAPFNGNGTKVKIPFEINLPLPNAAGFA